MNSWKNQIALKTLVPFAAAYLVLCVYRANDSSLEVLTQQWQSIVAVGALSFAFALFQDLFPKSWKESLVFWRIQERLPGYRAFNKNRRKSSSLRWDEIFEVESRSKLEARDQDRLFYRLYDRFREKGPVSNSSYRYLQWRELSFLSFVCAITVLVYFTTKRGFFDQLTFELTIYGLMSTGLSIIASRRSANDLVDQVLLAEYLEKTEKDGG